MYKKILQTSALGLSIISLGADTSPVRAIRVDAPQNCPRASIILMNGGARWGVGHGDVPGTVIVREGKDFVARETFQKVERDRIPLTLQIHMQVSKDGSGTPVYAKGEVSLRRIIHNLHLNPIEGLRPILDVINDKLKMTITTCPTQNEPQIDFTLSKK